MELTYGTPVVWLLHAQEIRETADAISDLSARKATMEIAERFEKMGIEARGRIMGSAPSKKTPCRVSAIASIGAWPGAYRDK